MYFTGQYKPIEENLVICVYVENVFNGAFFRTLFSVVVFVG